MDALNEFFAQFSPQDWLNMGIVALTVIGIIVAVVAMYPSWSEFIERRRLNKTFGANAYTEEEIKNAVRYYVEPDCSQMDPGAETEIRRAVLLRDKLTKVVNEFIENGVAEKHLLVLADSGMGKTAFTLHFFWQNSKLAFSKRKRIAIVPLGRKKALEAIKKFERPNETILILDAFDEDTEAINDHKARLNELMEAAQDFNRVIVTSRTQFFASDEEIPKETGIAIVAPRANGVGKTYKFYKLYLAPFTDKQVDLYIKKRFRFWQIEERARAKELIAKVPELIVRPMLLAQIPYLISDRNEAVDSLAEFYGYMVKKWFDREQGWVAAEALQDFSERLAVDIYLKRDIRQMERIPSNELKQLIDLNMPDVDHWKLTVRSLINRDAEGNYKFSHRSFMEYFYVLAYLKGDKSCLSVPWTDMMVTLFESAMSAQLPFIEDATVIFDDFSNAKVFSDKPWLWRQVARISTENSLASLSEEFDTRRTLETHISTTSTQIRIWSLKELQIESQPIFVDIGVDLIWCIPNDARSNAADSSLMAVPYWKHIQHQNALNKRSFASANDWRAPTLDEFEWIGIADQSETAIDEGKGYLYQETPYWCSDLLENGKNIVVSFGERPITNLQRQYKYLGFRSWKATVHRNLNSKMHIYEFDNVPDNGNRQVFRTGLSLWVSHHGALEFPTRQ